MGTVSEFESNPSEYYNKNIAENTRPCTRFQYNNSVGRYPGNCPTGHRRMCVFGSGSMMSRSMSKRSRLMGQMGPRLWGCRWGTGFRAMGSVSLWLGGLLSGLRTTLRNFIICWSRLRDGKQMNSSSRVKMGEVRYVIIRLLMYRHVSQ